MDLEQHFRMEIQREKQKMQRKLITAFAMLAAVYIISIVAFHYFENWDWENSLYFTTSTITTVGYGDLVPHTFWGRLFTIPLMWLGIAVGFYVIYTIIDYGKSKIENRIDETIDRVDEISGRSRKGK